MKWRRLCRFIELTLNPLATFDGAIRIPEWVVTLFGVSLTGMVASLLAIVTTESRGGIWAGLGVASAILLVLALRAGYQLQGEAETRVHARGVFAVVNPAMAAGRDLKNRIEFDWRDELEEEENDWRNGIVADLVRLMPTAVEPFLADGFPDAAIPFHEEWSPKRQRAFRDVTIRMWRLKEEVIDKVR